MKLVQKIKKCTTTTTAEHNVNFRFSVVPVFAVVVKLFWFYPG